MVKNKIKYSENIFKRTEKENPKAPKPATTLNPP